MSNLSLDSALLERLISKECAGGVDALRIKWGAFFGDESTVPNRATFYRWREGKLPRSPIRFLQLCGLLDVDPFALLLLPAGSETKAIQILYRSFWLNQWRQQALSFLPEFFGHQTNWPPTSIASEYFHKDWTVQSFSHNPSNNSNYYAVAKMTGDKTLIKKNNPQVFHFAYSQPSIFAHRWIQYGYVKRRSNFVKLINISGDIQHYDADSNDCPTNVETWFGPSPIDFRVASLHTFSLSVQNSSDKEIKMVRFCA